MGPGFYFEQAFGITPFEFVLFYIMFAPSAIVVLYTLAEDEIRAEFAALKTTQEYDNE